MEGDVEVSDDFRSEVLLLLSRLPASWSLLYLNGSFRKLGPAFRPGLVLSRGGVGAFGYVISFQGAKHFLQNAALQSDKAVDHMMDEEVLAGRILAFHAQPTLVHLIPDVRSTLAY